MGLGTRGLEMETRQCVLEEVRRWHQDTLWYKTKAFPWPGADVESERTPSLASKGNQLRQLHQKTEMSLETLNATIGTRPMRC